MINSFWKCPIQNLETKKLIYHALVESHLNYGILLYASNLGKNVTNAYSNNVKYIPSNLKPLVVTQNKILRAIFQVSKYDKNSKKYTEMLPLYKKLDVLKLEDLYRYNLGILCHNSINSLKTPDRIKDLFNLRIDIITRNTRTGDMDLYYETPKLTSTLKKPSLAGAALWNSLPENIKSIKSHTTFKAELKIHLSRNYDN